MCVCVSKISETTKYKALKKAKKSKFLCCAELARYVIANCFTGAKVRHLFRTDKEILKKYRNAIKLTGKRQDNRKAKDKVKFTSLLLNKIVH